MQSFPSESETSAALQRLVSDSIPKIGVLTGDLERSIYRVGDADYNVLTSFMTYRGSLLNQGFDMEEVSLKNGDIPSDISILMITDPKTAFDSASTEKIKKYIAAGGNLFIAGEPGRQSLLNPILQPLGVHMKDGILVQQSKDFDPALVLAAVTKNAVASSWQLQKAAKEELVVAMQGAAALSFDSNSAFNIRPLLMTNEKLSWNRKKMPVAKASTDVDTPDETVHSADMPGQNGGLSIASPKEVPFKPQIGPRPGQMPVMLSAATPAEMAAAQKQAAPASGAAPLPAGVPSAQSGSFSSSPGKRPALAGSSSNASRLSSTASTQTATAAGGYSAKAGQAAQTMPDSPMHIMLNGREITVMAAKPAVMATGQIKPALAQSGKPALAQPQSGQSTLSQVQPLQGSPVSAPASTLSASQMPGQPSMQKAAQTQPDPAGSVATHAGRSSIGVIPTAPHSQSQPGKVKADPAVSSFGSAMSPAPDDEHGSFPTALSLTRSINGKEQRIVVTSDADFMSNVELRRMNITTSNFNFGDAIFSWLGYEKFPIETSRPDPKDIRINVGDAGLSVIKTVLLGVLPALLLLLGTVILIRRKRK
jgi:hypothetical protein